MLFGYIVVMSLGANFKPIDRDFSALSCLPVVWTFVSQISKLFWATLLRGVLDHFFIGTNFSASNNICATVAGECIKKAL